MSATLPIATLKPKEDRRIQRGHAWAYRGEFHKIPELADGALVDVYSNERRFVGLRDINGGSSCGGQGCPVAHFGIAAGQYVLYAVLSDGRLGRKPVDVNSTQRRHLIVFHEQDFK